MAPALETLALGGYDLEWWHVAIVLALAAGAAFVALRYGGRLLAMVRGWSRSRQVITGAGILAVLAVGGYLFASSIDRPGDKEFEGEEFLEEGELKSVKRVRWPVYGYDDERTRYLPTKHVHPPYSSSSWSWHAGRLLEFSPIAVGNRLYVIDKNATVFALDSDTGKVDWRHDLGNLNASSPAYSDGKLFGVSLAPGQAFAMRADTGKVDWKTPLGARSETSPVVHGKLVIVGAESGDVFGLDTREGKVKWRIETGGEVKGGIAIHDGVAFFGNYAGEMWAVRANSGRTVWQTGTQGASFGRTGRIYSTPAVAFGRVYVGSVDSRVYSFVEDTGELAWSQSTGDWVYPAPAVADPPGAGPTVFIGSKDQSLYALDAEDGDIRWKERVGGIIIGAASVLGNIVYVSGIGPNIGTYGFDVADGSKEFEHELGEYNPVISDGRRLYLTGTSQIRAFEPKTLEEIKHEREVKRIKERRAREERRHKRQVAEIKERRQRERQAAEAERRRERRQAERQRKRERRQAQRD
jgi:outer membrane protein assembly factor BamB